jgi:ABC-type transport system involved in multi-copper enzyme maturation permease subunit
VSPVGIRAIEYRPWKGDRTDPNRRWLVISKHVFQRNIRNKGVIALLIIGMMFAHAFPIIGAILTPHEELTNEDMVGSEEEEGPDHWFNVTGELNITGDLMFDGTFFIDGFIALNDVNNTDPANYTDLEWNESRIGDGFLGIFGGLSGLGSIDGQGAAALSGNLTVEGGAFVVGSLRLGGGPEYFAAYFVGDSNISGFGNITGNGTISGKGILIGEVEKIEDDDNEFGNPGGYLTSGIFIIFAMLLAAIICADIISSDLANSSFVLYFSRPVRAMDYLLGKFVGLIWVMSIFCLIPPIAYVLVMMGTQTGDDYSGGIKILGLTIVAGLVTAIYFLPFGLMISSFTKSKAYAGIGIFMSFFVLLIISEIFSENSTMWSLISPVELLFNFYNILFDGTLPEGIEAWQVGVSILAFTVIPMAIVIFKIQRKGAGK